jgi:adenylosuccinate lyase
LKESCDVLLVKVDALLEVLKKRAFEFKDTPQIGRTHGIHAEPTSFGLVWALWFAEMQRNKERLRKARKLISAGKISGAVGAFAHLAPEVEEKVCWKLGLMPAEVSTQIIQRDRYAEYLCTLAIIASSLEKMALQVRHWQRTEVREAQEKFKTGQKGSSSMPHKRNPILSERICGMARTVRANSIVGLENIALWHERDISHSSAERIVLPDSSAATDYILAKATSLLNTLIVYPENMLKNLNLTHGLVFSGQLLLALTQKGVSREDAYLWTQRNAMKVWDEGGEFQDLIAKDADISSKLTPEEIARVFDIKHYLRNVEKIFKRVFD